MLNQLTALIDAHGLAPVVDALAEICNVRGEPDSGIIAKKEARIWRQAARILEQAWNALNTANIR